MRNRKGCEGLNDSFRMRQQAEGRCAQRSSLFSGMCLAPAPSPVSRVQRTKPCPFAAYPKRYTCPLEFVTSSKSEPSLNGRKLSELDAIPPARSIKWTVVINRSPAADLLMPVYTLPALYIVRLGASHWKSSRLRLKVTGATDGSSGVDMTSVPGSGWRISMDRV